MPYYVDDFEADTPHLGLEEDGAYNRLLRLCWRSPECSIPDDAAWIQRRLRVDMDTYNRIVAPLLDEFFTRDKGKVWQKRQRQEYAYVMAMVAKRKEAGAKGGYTKALRRKEIDPNNTTVLPVANGYQNGSNGLASTSTSTSTSIEDKREAIASPKTKGSRLAADWQIPPDWAAWATAEGLPDPPAESDRFRDYWIATPGAKGVKADWLATWRNWVRKAITDQAAKPGRTGQSQSDPRNDPKHGDEKIGIGGVKLKWSAPRNQWLKAEDWKP
jgi:uncharacterized protein YdaU (DUF1376 family)